MNVKKQVDFGQICSVDFPRIFRFCFPGDSSAGFSALVPRACIPASGPVGSEPVGPGLAASMNRSEVDFANVNACSPGAFLLLGFLDLVLAARTGSAHWQRSSYWLPSQPISTRSNSWHTGLTHCQARGQEKPAFHLNISVAAAHMLRLLARKAGCSPRIYRREALGGL